VAVVAAAVVVAVAAVADCQPLPAREQRVNRRARQTCALTIEGMKFLVLAIALLAARPADACGVAVFGSPSSSSDVPPAPPPPEPENRHLATKIIGGLLVLSVMSRWIVAMPRRVIA
jgi:hypothetical protein